MVSRKELYFRNKSKNPHNKKKQGVKKLYTSKQISGFIEKTKELKNLGKGKRKLIIFRVPKKRMTYHKGQIIKEHDGLYIISRIMSGCSSRRTATIRCIPFDPKNIDSNKVLIPK